jgi:hypothetical protein
MAPIDPHKQASKSLTRPVSLELQAVYSIVELARAANVSPNRMRRLLRAAGIALLRSGRVLLVPFSEIETKIPPLWASLIALERSRKAAAQPTR